jgi:hypothetical protein
VRPRVYAFSPSTLVPESSLWPDLSPLKQISIIPWLLNWFSLFFPAAANQVKIKHAGITANQIPNLFLIPFWSFQQFTLIDIHKLLFFLKEKLYERQNLAHQSDIAQKYWVEIITVGEFLTIIENNKS